MDKYKYQLLALFIAILIGGSIGHLLSSSISNKEIKKLTEQHATNLKNEVKTLEEKISVRDKRITQLDSLSKLDSARYITLQRSIQKDREVTEIKREQAKHFTDEEIRNYLMSRYSSKP